MIAPVSQLTILLTLKGRHDYTYRWLWHANRTRLPFRILIADGEPESPVAGWLAGEAFAHLQVEYRKYNDRTYRDFYEKILDAARRIETPYVMICDNDDFLFPGGIIRSVDFLERSSDYVSAGGGIAQFELSSSRTTSRLLGGRIARFWYQQSRPYRAYDLCESSVVERTIKTYTDQLTVHYNVTRVPALRCIAEELVKANFQQLVSAEIFWKLRLATLGKLRSDASRIFYLRQQGTSTNPQRGVDFIEILGSQPYIAEIQRALDAVAFLAAEADGVDKEKVVRELRRISVTHLRSQLRSILGSRAAARNWFDARFPPRFMQALRSVYGRVSSGENTAAGGRPVSRQALMDRLGRNGASRESIDEQGHELAEVEATLSSSEFVHADGGVTHARIARQSS